MNRILTGNVNTDYVLHWLASELFEDPCWSDTTAPCDVNGAIDDLCPPCVARVLCAEVDAAREEEMIEYANEHPTQEQELADRYEHERAHSAARLG